MENEPLEPTLEKAVDFYGDIIPVAQTGDEAIYVPITPLSNFLGLSIAGQRQRILRNEAMSAEVRNIEMAGAGGRKRLQLCLPLDLLPGWLFGIDTNRVKPELKDKLVRYQREAFKVLWNAFKGDIVAVPQQPVELTSAEQILAQFEALTAMARQQVELERRQDDMANFMRPFVAGTRRELIQHDQRITALELRLDPAAQITDAEAAEIALSVKNVAYAMGKGSSSYGKVYSELYRRYRVSSYKNLPRAKYDEVIAWLSRWYDEVTKGQEDDKE